MPKSGHTATVPATASCWSERITLSGSTAKPSRKHPRWLLDDSSPLQAGTTEAVGQEPPRVRGAGRGRRVGRPVVPVAGDRHVHRLLPGQQWHVLLERL